jgi:hypothetical protein
MLTTGVPLPPPLPRNSVRRTSRALAFEWIADWLPVKLLWVMVAVPLVW